LQVACGSQDIWAGSHCGINPAISQPAPDLAGTLAAAKRAQQLLLV
jgi:hypothetical protein